jgi:putative solute:sodium symporter small subunit
MQQITESHKQYWRKNLNLTAVLLAIWFVVTFVVSFFARDLSFNFFGWPFSFWMGAQGSLIVYVVIIWFYAKSMNQLDNEHGVAEVEE